MRAFITGIILVFAYVLQSTVLQYIEVWNIKPNLLIMLIIYFALIRGSVEGGIIGLAGGILMDILAGKVFGIHSLLGLYIGVFTGIFNKRFFKESYFVGLLFIAIFTFVYEFLFYLINYFIWGETRIIFVLQRIIIPEVIYNCILAVPVYYFVIKVNHWIKNKKKASRKY